MATTLIVVPFFTASDNLHDQMGVYNQISPLFIFVDKYIVQTVVCDTLSL